MDRLLVEPRPVPRPEAFLARCTSAGCGRRSTCTRLTACARSRTPTRRWRRRSGHDTSDEAPITFDITDPAFVEAYLGILHRRLEDQGVDFWWIDWQSGPHSRVPGIDPLWMLNHFHFLDSGRDGRRPLVLSRYAGPGSHRYPVGFSGDTVISWESLDFQPEFTATASNIGYGWWSHDIGGHFGGVRDDELTTRWVQYGVFSPILRLHSSNNPFLVKEPWAFGAEARAADRRGAAAAAPAGALPALDEPSRRHGGRAAGAADVPPAPDRAAGVRGAEPVRLRLRAPRGADHDAARSRSPCTAPPPRGCRPAPGPTSSPGGATRVTGCWRCTATRRRSRCCCLPAGS